MLAGGQLNPMKVIIGCVDTEFNVNLIKAEACSENTHESAGISSDYNFRVVGNTIHWWFEIPNEDIRETVYDKLRRKYGVKGPYKNVRLSREMVSFNTRFEHCHGYPQS